MALQARSSQDRALPTWALLPSLILADHDHWPADLGYPRGAQLDHGSLDLGLRRTVDPDHRGRNLDLDRVKFDRCRADLRGNARVALHCDAVSARDRDRHALDLYGPVLLHDQARLPGGECDL